MFEADLLDIMHVHSRRLALRTRLTYTLVGAQHLLADLFISQQKVMAGVLSDWGWQGY